MATTTTDTILKDGLEALGYPEGNKSGCRMRHGETNNAHKDLAFLDVQVKMTTLKKNKIFKAAYGSDPLVILKMWEAHIVTPDEDARINPGEMTMKHYLFGHNLIALYGTVKVHSHEFKVDKNTALKWGNIAVDKICALAATKIARGVENDICEL